MKHTEWASDNSQSMRFEPCDHGYEKIYPKLLSFHIQECEFVCECGAKVRPIKFELVE